jgi:hypothetical protein
MQRFFTAAALLAIMTIAHGAHAQGVRGEISDLEERVQSLENQPQSLGALVFRDANNLLIGFVLNPGGEVIIDDGANRYVVQIFPDGFHGNDGIQFLEPNCQGTPYISTTLFRFDLVVARINDGRVWLPIDPTAATEPITRESEIDQTNNCVNAVNASNGKPAFYAGDLSADFLPPFHLATE